MTQRSLQSVLSLKTTKGKERQQMNTNILNTPTPADQTSIRPLRADERNSFTATAKRSLPNLMKRLIFELAPDTFVAERETVDITALNAEIDRIVQRSNKLRTAIDAIIMEIEGTV
jgi:hypothetical protein